MFLKLGDSYTMNLLVQDLNENRITNDTPYVNIQNLQTKEYYTGIGWQSSPFNILIPHIGNGIYSYSFTPDVVGVFQLDAISINYSKSKTEQLDVYETDLAKMYWLTNSQFIFSFISVDESDVPYIKIVKEKDNTFWNGLTWSNDEYALSMSLITDSVFQYPFTPDEESEYSIVMYNSDNEELFILSVTDTGDNTMPITVSSSTLKSLDGTDSVILNDSQLPLQGVKVTAYNEAKEIVARTYSNITGEWDMSLKPGNYYFTFDYAGYTSVGFERAVM